MIIDYIIKQNAFRKLKIPDKNLTAFKLSRVLSRSIETGCMVIFYTKTFIVVTIRSVSFRQVPCVRDFTDGQAPLSLAGCSPMR